MLAYFDTSGVQRLAHGFRDFQHYRLRSCSPAQVNADTDNGPTMLNSEAPVWDWAAATRAGAERAPHETDGRVGGGTS